MRSSSLDRFRVVFDLLDELPDEILEVLRAGHAKGAAAPMSEAARAFHRVLAEDVFGAEQQRRRDGRPAFMVAVTFAMIPDLTEREVRVLRSTALQGRDFNAAVPALSAFYGALAAVLGRRHQPADDGRHLGRLN